MPENTQTLSAFISDEDKKMTPEQEAAFGNLLKHILQNGKWGYKSERNEVDRELAFQSEKVAERLYGHIYRSNPQIADRLWEENTGHTPSAKFHEKIKGQAVTLTATEALPELNKRVESITENINQARRADLAEMQQQQLPQLSHMLGETKQRQIDYRRKALQGTFKDEKEIDGISILKTFMRGVAHGKEGMTNWRREGLRGKTIQNSIKEIEGNMKELTKKTIMVAVNRGEKVFLYDEKGKPTPQATKLLGKDISEIGNLSYTQTPAATGMKLAAQRASQLIDRLSGKSVDEATPIIDQGTVVKNNRRSGPQFEQAQGRELNIGG